MKIKDRISPFKAKKTDFLKESDEDSVKNHHERLKIIVSHLSIIAAITSIGYTILYAVLFPNNITFSLDIFVSILLVVVYFLNKHGYTNLACYMFLAVTNIFLFVYADLLPQESGISLIYFPIMGGTVIFAIHKPTYVRILFISIPIMALFVLQFFNYEVFGKIPPIQRPSEINYYINLSISTITFAIAIYYMMNIYDNSLLALESSRDKFKKLAKQFKRTNKNLKKTNKELDQFLYSTSHDLRAPLVSLMGIIQLIEYEKDYSKLNQYLSLMKSRVENMDSFIKDISSYSKNIKSEVQKEQIDLKDFIDNIIDNFRYFNDADQIDFKNRVAIKEPILVDRFRLQIILNNLIGNAIKYHTLEKEYPRIEIFIDKKEHGLFFSVKDNGPGIDPKILDRIFDMFYRGSEQSDGSGLGLYLVKEVVHILKGKIKVKSQLGVGTEFTFTIPF